MKKQLLGYSIFGALLISGNVLAECPNSLSADQLYDCIVVEGAGGSYQMPVSSEKAKSEQTSQTDEEKRNAELAELKR